MDKFVTKVSRKAEDKASGSDSSGCKEKVKCFTANASTSKSKVKRMFNYKWISQFAWLTHDKLKDLAYCKLCQNAYKNKLLQFSTKLELTFISTGFSNWKKAIDKFKSHEKSFCHRESLLKLSCENVNVCTQLSNVKLEEMQKSRVALLKILSSIKFLAIQGIAIRGHDDNASNLINLLKLRSEDSPELKLWLNRTKYKWLSHDLLNEMLQIMAHSVLKTLINEIKKAQYYSVMVDETTDISTHEQVSICFRFVNEKLDPEEIFLGFYSTDNTKSETLFNIINDVLQRFDLNISNCRGQCFDGASNMSGIHTGVQSRLRELEPRAIFVHCLAHSLNLVVQESVRLVSECRDTLNLARELITFVKNSPKRLSCFTKIQAEDSLDHVNLRPFCPTRWTIRHSSMASILNNYAALLSFFDNLAENDCSDAGSKANGFSKQLKYFDFFFFLSLFCKLFCHIDAVNTALQKKSLCFQNAYQMINTLKMSIGHIRNQFNIFWEEVIMQAKNANIDEPKLPRQKRLPKRLDDETSDLPNAFSSPIDYYRSKYYMVIDVILKCLQSRFETSSSNFLRKLEQFLTEGIDTNLREILDFYKDDIDGERLLLHRNMLLDILKAKKIEGIEDINSILNLLKSDTFLYDMLPEIKKLIQLILTIPVSTCTAERSFSALRRLKTFTRSTMGQSRLNSLAVLHCHREISSTIKNEEIYKEFISRSEIRRRTFAATGN